MTIFETTMKNAFSTNMPGIHGIGSLIREIAVEISEI